MDDDLERRREMSATTVELSPDRAVAAVPSPIERTPFDRGPDRFEIRGELGRGGMGKVEDAFDRSLERPVAIKHVLFGSELDVARFAREVRITARLEHPGIVPIHEAGITPDGTPYYVMRRVDGRPLSELVAKASPAERLALIPNVLAACDAIAYAHARRVVHRDLKPENILIGPFGETLVIDWGLAREIEPDAAVSGNALAIPIDGLTVAGAVAGTPGFMAPEQARGESVDARSDVFALGATLFFVLAGKPLYDSKSATEMIDLAGTGGAPQWNTLPPRVPADLRAILGKALATDPAQRYRDAGAFAGDLRRFIAGNLVAAREYGALARLIRYVRRHRVIVAVIAASAIAIAVVATLSVRRILAERDDARAARAVAESRQREARDAADLLLVQRARELATTDPIGTIALLRRLDAGSARWRDAWLAAAAAWARGLPIGFHHDSKVLWLQVSGDDRSVVVTTASGAISVIDIATRTRRTVATIDRPHMCQWLAARQLVCIAHGEQVVLVDLATAAVRPLALSATHLVTDRRSRALLQGVDGAVYELTSDGRFRALATGVELAGSSADLAHAALWHGNTLELLTGATPVTIARFPAGARAQSSAVAIQGDTVAGVIGDTIYRWQMTGDKVVATGHWPRRGEIQVLIAGHRLFANARDELRAVDSGARISTTPSWLFPTPLGLGVVQTDGSIGLLDADGWFELGPYPTQLDRADLALDGKVLVGASDLADVLVWNVDELRRPLTDLASTAEPAVLAPPYLWVRDTVRGVVRHDLASGEDKLVLPGGIPMMPGVWFAVAEDGRWSAFRDPGTGQLAVYDAANDKHGTVGPAVGQSADADGIVVVRSDGLLGRWRPGTPGLAEIGRLPEAPQLFGVSGGTVVAELADGKLYRLDPGGGSARGALDAPLRDLAVERSGRAWLVTSHGELWRWERDASPTRVATAEPIDILVTTGERILARSPRSLIAIDRDPPHAVPADARLTAWMGANYIACLSARGAISVLDLETGGSITLHATAATDALVAHGDSLMFATSVASDGRNRFATVELRVPHDPAALRAWLDQVTNARASEGGLGGIWP